VQRSDASSRQLSLRDRRVLVFGLARSGQAAAELLHGRGAEVLGVDEGPAAPSLLAGEWARAHLQRGSVRADPAQLEGVELLVLSPGIPTSHPLVQAAAARQIPVLSEIELAYRCSTASIVAVTGSKGKSTTVALVGALLAAQGKRCVVAGNIGLPYSAVVERVGANDWVVLEVSSFQLETVDTFHARVAVHLAVSPDHLDRYPSLEAYAAAKARIARHQTHDDVLIVDPEDPYGATLARSAAARVLGFGRAWQGAGVSRHGDDLVWSDASGTEVLAHVEDVPLLGTHNVRNAMAALAVARALGPVDGAVRQALRSFEALPYRMQPCGEIGGIRFVNDSKGTTVEAVRAGVQGLPGPLLLGLGGRNKELDFTALRPHLGAVHAVLVFGEAAPEIEAALQGAVRLERVSDLDDMVGRALQLGRPGDTFLFSPGCTSFDMFRNAEHRGEEFDAAVGRARARAEGAKT
jgi:UDP-N-acetylmuramoylalanine--D-glutamate ligase